MNYKDSGFFYKADVAGASGFVYAHTHVLHIHTFMTIVGFFLTF